MEYKTYKCKNFKLDTVKLDRFKTGHLEVFMRKEVKKEEITLYRTLVKYLIFVNNKYRTRRELNIECENLYNLRFSGSLGIIGNELTIGIYFDFLNPKYCDSSFTDELLEFVHDILFNPLMVDGKFSKEYLDVIKEKISNSLDSLNESPAFVASSICKDTFNEPSSYRSEGYKEDLAGINVSNLYECYKTFFTDFTFSMYLVGNLDMDLFYEKINSLFKIDKLVTKKPDLYVVNDVREVPLDFKKIGKYHQDNIRLVYNTVSLTSREKNYVMPLFNSIFGSGGLTSKLYQYVREENSLCYSIGSFFSKNINMFTISAGINAKDKDLVIELVNKALDEMSRGDFTLEQLNNAKKSIANEMESLRDVVFYYVDECIFKEIDGRLSEEERLREYNSVTKEEIAALTSKLKLNLIFMLEGDAK